MSNRLDAIEASLVVAAPGAITITPSDVSYLLTLARKQQAALDALIFVADNRAALNTHVGRWWSEIIKGTISQHMDAP